MVKARAWSRHHRAKNQAEYDAWLAWHRQRSNEPDYDAWEASIQQRARQAAKAAMTVGIDARDLALFAVEADERHYDGALADAAELLAMQQEDNRRTRGRKLETDPKDDKRIYDGWQNSGCRSIEEYAAVCGRSARQIRLAVDRHKKRLAKK